LSAATAITSMKMIEATRQRDRAEYQSRRAQASSEFMRNLVTQIGNKPMTMREVLDRGRVSLEQQHPDDPAFVARVLIQLSGPYLELGDTRTASQMMARAHEIARKVDEPDLLAATHCGRGYDLLENRDFEGARRHLAEGARHAQRAFSPGLNAECAMGETKLALAEGRPEDAVRHVRHAVDLLEQAGITRTSRYTSALDNLARTLYGAGRLPEALATHARVTEISRQIGRGKTIGVVVSLQNQAVVLRRMGRWIESEHRLLEAIELARGVDRAGRVPAFVLANHARLLADLRRGADARAALDRVRAQADLTAEFAAIADLGEALVRIDSGDVSGARAIYTKLQNPQKTALPQAHWYVLPILAAQIASGEGRHAEARGIIDRAVEESGFPGTVSAAQPELLACAGALSLDLGDLAGAIQRSQDAIRTADSQFGREAVSVHVGRARLTLGIALASKKSMREATGELEQASRILRQSAGAAHPWTVDADARLAVLNR
jgi:tetratricopeptide (TPR) repeat protein